MGTLSAENKLRPQKNAVAKRPRSYPKEISVKAFWLLVAEKMRISCGRTFQPHYLRECFNGVRVSKSIADDLECAKFAVDAEMRRRGQTVSAFLRMRASTKNRVGIA